MAGAAQIPLFSAAKVAQDAQVRQADNGLCWASFGEVHNSADELEKIVQAVPAVVAAALRQRAWYFVPLAIGENDDTVVAPDYTVDLGIGRSATETCALAGRSAFLFRRG